MKSRVAKLLAVMLTMGLLAFAFAGCGEPAEPEEEVKGEVELLYVEWECATASTNVMKHVLEDQGYDVTITSVGAAAMWEGIAAGQGDAMTTAWLPVTHGHYLEEVEGDVEILGTNYEGARIGLMVPEYCDIDSVEDINDYLDEIDGEIIGIDPGAGLMSATEEAIEVYGLDVELIEGSDATMTGALSAAINNEECIIVTGWVPHWKAAEWDLKFLEDPEGIFGEVERIDTVARAGLSEDMPEVAEILGNFNWGDEEIGEVMAAEDPDQGAREWVDNNQDIVEQWLP